MSNFSASPNSESKFSLQHEVTARWSESLVREVLLLAYLIYAIYILLSFSCFFFFPSFLVYFFFFFFSFLKKQNIPEWIQCNICIKQWLSFTKFEVKSTDPGSFLPVHILSWMCCNHSWVFMGQGQRLHVVKKVVLNWNFKIPRDAARRCSKGSF